MSKQDDDHCEPTPVDAVRSSDGLSDAAFLADMRTYKLDHEPDGWPAIQQKNIDRLIDIIDKQRDILKRCLDDARDNNYESKGHRCLFRVKLEAIKNRCQEVLGR